MNRDRIGKRSAAVLLLVLMVLLMPVTASADTGPKPSVVIDFRGFEHQPFYVTLLSETSSTGPFSAVDEASGYGPDYGPEDEDYEIWQAFMNYRDEDGYYFLQFFQDCTETSRFEWIYYPPKRFKILIYFPEENRFLEGEQVLERYAFDSYFTAEADPSGSSLIGQESKEKTEEHPETITANKSYDFAGQITSLLFRIAATIAIELAVALPFGLRQKKLLTFIAAVNLMTQAGLNLLLNLFRFAWGNGIDYILCYALLEVLVFCVESYLYSRKFRRCDGEQQPEAWVAPVYALTANGASFTAGFFLAWLLPELF